MPKGSRGDLPVGITPKLRKVGDRTEQVVTNGTPVYRVRVWDAVLTKQMERTVGGEADPAGATAPCGAHQVH
jgi:hypothetical protein